MSKDEKLITTAVRDKLGEMVHAGVVVVGSFRRRDGSVGNRYDTDNAKIGAAVREEYLRLCKEVGEDTEATDAEA